VRGVVQLIGNRNQIMFWDKGFTLPFTLASCPVGRQRSTLDWCESEGRRFQLRESNVSVTSTRSGSGLVLSYAVVPFAVCSSAWCLVASSVW
jgi:hypothetical protein